MHRKIQRQGGRGVGIIGGRGVVGVLSPLRWARDSPLPRAQVVQSRIKIQKYRKYTVEIHCDRLTALSHAQMVQSTLMVIFLALK